MSQIDVLRLDGVHILDTINGTSGGDDLQGTFGDDVINGLGGNDTIWGGDGGNDTLNGGDGDDQLTAMSGDDNLSGEAGNDSIIAGGGNDTLDGGSGDDTMSVGAGDLIVDGGDGQDAVSFHDISFTGVTVSLLQQGEVQDYGAGTIVLTGVEAIYGTFQNDVLVGDDNENVFATGKGWDSVACGGGDDLVILGMDSGGTLDGGDGVDTLVVGASTPLMLDLNEKGAQSAQGQPVRFRGFENLSAGPNFSDNDTFIGSKVANILAGAAGDDHLIGGVGSDTLVGDGVISGDFSATLQFDIGAVGADTLEGGKGADTLIGGRGADILVGGAGNDVFRFLDLGDSDGVAGVDVITDLGKKDVIDLSAIDADIITAGDQAFHLVKAFHGQAGELVRTYDSGADVTHLFGDLDGDGQADMQIDVSGDKHAFTGFVL